VSKEDGHPFNIQRYASVAYGIRSAENGNLVKVQDIVAALEYILDSDEFVQARAETLLLSLRKEL